MSKTTMKLSSSSSDPNEPYILDTMKLVDQLAGFNDIRAEPQLQILSMHPCGKDSCFAENTWFILHRLNISNSDPNKTTAYVMGPHKEIQLYLKNFRYGPEVFEDDDIFEDD